MKVDVSNPAFRFAFYEAYSHKCHYTKEPIVKFSDLELDHIIPKSYKGNPDELSKILHKYGLSDYFDLESVYNIVPTTIAYNRDKGTDIFPTIVRDLVMAKRKSAKVIECYYRFINTKLTEKVLAKVGASIGEGILSQEEAYNIVSNQQSYFSSNESFVDEKYCASFSKSTPRVFLNGFLPTLLDENPTCCVSFKSFELRSLMMTMNHQDIVNLNKKKHAGTAYTIIPKNAQLQEFSDCAMFNYKNVNFINTIQELDEFFEVINLYQEKLDYCFDKIHHILGAKNLEYSKQINGYRLGKIKKGLWRLMLKFANEFDFGKGTSEWHIFDSKRSVIIVSTSSNNNNYDQCFHAMIEPEQIVSNSYFDFTRNDDDMWIVWNKMNPSVNQDDVDEYSERRTWNAQITHNWLKSDFIPYVVWYYEVKHKRTLYFWKRQVSFKKFLKNFQIENYIWD